MYTYKSTVKRNIYVDRLLSMIEKRTVQNSFQNTRLLGKCFLPLSVQQNLSFTILNWLLSSIENVFLFNKQPTNPQSLFVRLLLTLQDLMFRHWHSAFMTNTGIFDNGLMCLCPSSSNNSFQLDYTRQHFPLPQNSLLMRSCY